MTAREIVDRLCGSDKGVTKLRIEKAVRLAQRSKVEWTEVLAAMTHEERLMVFDAQKAD